MLQLLSWNSKINNIRFEFVLDFNLFFRDCKNTGQMLYLLLTVNQVEDFVNHWRGGENYVTGISMLLLGWYKFDKNYNSVICNCKISVCTTDIQCCTIIVYINWRKTKKLIIFIYSNFEKNDICTVTKRNCILVHRQKIWDFEFFCFIAKEFQ